MGQHWPKKWVLPLPKARLPGGIDIATATPSTRGNLALDNVFHPVTGVKTPPTRHAPFGEPFCSAIGNSTLLCLCLNPQHYTLSLSDNSPHLRRRCTWCLQERLQSSSTSTWPVIHKSKPKNTVLVQIHIFVEVTSTAALASSLYRVAGW